MFVPLRVISGYSFLKSGLTMEKISHSVLANNYLGAGLADFSYLYGVPHFFEEMKRIKKKAIIGISVLINNYSLVLYALNEDGYKNLIIVSSFISKGENVEDYLKDNHKGLLGVLESFYNQFPEEFDEPDFAKKVAKISNLVDEFYIGVEVDTKEDIEYANRVRKFASNHIYQTVAFPRISYQKKNEAITLDILKAIDKGEKIESKSKSGEEYFKSIEAYEALYNKDELDLTVEILESTTFEFNKKRGQLYHFPVNDSIDTLKRKVHQGLKDKGILDQKHIDRCKKELDVIIEMGFQDYFLIVSDYVSYAKSHDILVGPGRGSAAGSLVSYCLNITEVDPLDYDLQFERFLNKARKTMPDIDVDFMDSKREEMVEYMRQTYGNDKVADIVAIQTIQAKQALRDIGRIYDIPTRHIDLLSKAIPDKVSLREAYKTVPQFKTLVDSDKYFLEIVSLASKIEGLPRQAGTHAAGIVLNQDPLTSVIPVTVDYDDHYTVQYEKDYLEPQGILKMDFLAIRTLSIIDYCIKLVNENHQTNLDFYHLPYLDKDIYKIFKNLQTIGIFQLESSGMKNAMKILKPECFDDIVALIALFRPGPMDNIKDYADRKAGKIKPHYLSKEVEEILSSTYGVLIYQEQISSLAIKMAGYSPEEADLFRRAVSHKEKSVLESSKKQFVSGCVKNGYKQNDAISMFNNILKFADYGFNKSHAVVYAIIACRMAYLKYHYPLEFYASILTISSGGTDAKFGDYVSELKKRNLKVLLPNINKSDKHFVIDKDGLLFPINMIRGVNIDVTHKILDERLLHGEFTDFFNFVSRMYSQNVSEIVLIKLINSGALDIFNKNRETLRATLHYAYQLAELSLDNEGQLILDSTLDHQKQYFETKDDPLTNLNLEYEELGIMLSDNPLRYKKDLLDKYKVVSISDVNTSSGYINIAGIVSTIKVIKSKKNNTSMAFIKVFDEVGEIEVIVFASLYEKVFSIIEKNNILLISGRIDHKEDKESFIANEIRLLEE